MSYSPLAEWLGTNSFQKAVYPKVGICLHHSAGTAENLKGIFDSRKVSTQYSVGPNHTYAYVDEDYVSWATGTTNGNRNWINIEVINSGGSPDWPVADETYDNLIPLLADIAKRQGFYPLVKYQNISEHKRFVATYCSGRVGEKMDEIIERVNALIASGGDITVNPAKPPAVIEKPIVKYGSTGSYVEQVQKAIGVTVDGDFGKATSQALAAYQKAHGLVADAICGSATWKVIDANPVAIAPAAPASLVAHAVLSLGSRGEDVKTFQKLINKIYGTAALEIDGIYGAASVRAAKQFQKDRGLVQDGITGAATWRELEK
jgi:peptidoglycan hydrolase-like protein with peptidoglycan-binding domain